MESQAQRGWVGGFQCSQLWDLGLDSLFRCWSPQWDMERGRYVGAYFMGEESGSQKVHRACPGWSRTWTHTCLTTHQIHLFGTWMILPKSRRHSLGVFGREEWHLSQHLLKHLCFPINFYFPAGQSFSFWEKMERLAGMLVLMSHTSDDGWTSWGCRDSRLGSTSTYFSL